MKNYEIYMNQDYDIKAVKVGWTWFGALFNIFWALYNKMWTYAGGILIGSILLSLTYIPFVEDNIAHILTNIIELTIVVLFGVLGNRWKGKTLISQGYILQNIIEAENEKSAIQSFHKL